MPLLDTAWFLFRQVGANGPSTAPHSTRSELLLSLQGVLQVRHLRRIRRLGRTEQPTGMQLRCEGVVIEIHCCLSDD